MSAVLDIAPRFAAGDIVLVRDDYPPGHIRTPVYVRGKRGRTPEALHEILSKFYAKEPFVHVLPFGETPHTRHVRGSNMTMIGVVADRVPGRAIVISALDNLVKGASGQAIQNMNLVMGYPETMGIDQVALFP